MFISLLNSMTNFPNVITIKQCCRYYIKQESLFLTAFSNTEKTVSYQTINQYGSTAATTEHICRYYHALYGACSQHVLLHRSPASLSESGYYRMRMHWRIRFPGEGVLNKV